MYSRLGTFLFFTFALTACDGALKHSLTDDSITNENMSEINRYKGIRYFNGGWYGPYPNFMHDLILKINSDKTVRAKLLTPNCEIRSTLNRNVYQELVREVLSSPKELNPFVHVTDRGDKVITLQEASHETHYFLRVSDNSSQELLLKNPEKIEILLQRIISQLESRDKNCNDPVVGVAYDQSTHRDYISTSDAIFILPAKQANIEITSRSVSLDLIKQKMKTASEGISDGVYYCYQEYNGQPTQRIIEQARKLKIQNSYQALAGAALYPCNSHNADAKVILTLTRQSGAVESLTFGSHCEAQESVENLSEFELEISRFLSECDSSCRMIFRP